MKGEIILVAGNSNIELAQEIGQFLGKKVVTPATKYPDGEIRVDFGDKEEASVRGKDVFIIQPSCNSASGSINDNLMELLIMIRALKGASVRIATVVMPYYGYARQDKKVEPRTAISARLMADLIQVAGADRVLMMDLHSNQIQGFFDVTTCPVDHLYAKPVLIECIRNKFKGNGLTVLTPDAGGVDRARSYAKELDAELALAYKKRENPSKVTGIQIIGNVEGRRVIILDDMIDTFGTMDEAVKTSIEKGASEVYIAAIHAVLSEPALKRIAASPVTSIMVTNTIPLSMEAKTCKKIEVISVAKIFAEAISRIYEEKSVSALFM